MGEAQRLVDAVKDNAEDSPYRVEETEDGFRVQLDIADNRWWGPLSKSGLKRTASYDVRVDEAAKTIAITDTLYELNWRVGTSVEEVASLQPTLAEATAESKSGRLYHRETRKTWAFDESGRFAKVVDYSFNTSEGRDMIRGPAKALGWKERMPLKAKIGILVGILGGAIAIITAIALVVSG